MVMEVVVEVATEVVEEVPKVSEHWLDAWGTALKGLGQRELAG